MYLKFFKFFHLTGAVMYIGGILSHIVILSVAGHDLQALYNGRIFMEYVAYILIAPGLAIALVAGTLMFLNFSKRPKWLWVKAALSLYLAIMATFFLIPMNPELTELAKASLEAGAISDAFRNTLLKEEIIGAANTLPILIIRIFGVFKPGMRKSGSSFQAKSA